MRAGKIFINDLKQLNLLEQVQSIVDSPPDATDSRDCSIGENGQDHAVRLHSTSLCSQSDLLIGMVHLLQQV